MKLNGEHLPNSSVLVLSDKGHLFLLVACVHDLDAARRDRVLAAQTSGDAA